MSWTTATETLVFAFAAGVMNRPVAATATLAIAENRSPEVTRSHCFVSLDMSSLNFSFLFSVGSNLKAKSCRARIFAVAR